MHLEFFIMYRRSNIIQIEETLSDGSVVTKDLHALDRTEAVFDLNTGKITFKNFADIDTFLADCYSIRVPATHDFFDTTWVEPSVGAVHSIIEAEKMRLRKQR